MLTEKLSASRGVIEALRGLYANFLVQEFIDEAQGADLRCFVVGGRVVAAMKRQAPKGDFRSNLHRGGTRQGRQGQRAEKEVAVRAAQRARAGRGRRRPDPLRAAGRWCSRSMPRPGWKGSRRPAASTWPARSSTYVANGLKPIASRRPMQRIALSRSGPKVPFSQIHNKAFNGRLIACPRSLLRPQHCFLHLVRLVVTQVTVIGAIPFWPKRGGPALGPLFVCAAG